MSFISARAPPTTAASKARVPNELTGYAADAETHRTRMSHMALFGEFSSTTNGIPRGRMFPVGITHTPSSPVEIRTDRLVKETDGIAWRTAWKASEECCTAAAAAATMPWWKFARNGKWPRSVRKKLKNKINPASLCAAGCKQMENETLQGISEIEERKS
ncbi:hypothetical protein ZHAS_00007533 [Anopheles sinensis]|uniref:Uncharacterized protein n=1 Tax=Anopheles sinensis TaxID=74873 RepID=A0A084VQ27_ANOSI|nr:hypothetical protein ZHAS_00007533 [Anopheles sinensis]